MCYTHDHSSVIKRAIEIDTLPYLMYACSMQRRLNHEQNSTQRKCAQWNGCNGDQDDDLLPIRLLLWECECIFHSSCVVMGTINISGVNSSGWRQCHAPSWNDAKSCHVWCSSVCITSKCEIYKIQNNWIWSAAHRSWMVSVVIASTKLYLATGWYWIPVFLNTRGRGKSWAICLCRLWDTIIQL